MFENIKKKLNNDVMTKLFYGVTGLVILDRIVCLVLVLFGKNLFMTSHEMYKALYWSAEEYALCFLLPVAGYAYFCSSSYGKNTQNKIKMYMGTYACLAALCFVMLGQWTNELLLFLASVYKGGNIIKIALDGAPDKLYGALRAGTLYVPICFISVTLTSVAGVLNDEHPVNKVKALSMLPTKTPPDAVGEMTCEVKLCNDLNSGKPVMVTEARRMEAILIQGATGTGKTSTILLPMCASDLEKKYFFMEKSKELGMKALKAGCAYINAPYDNETLNRCFSLNLLRPIYGKEDEFEEILKPMIKYRDEANKTFIFKDLGVTVLEPDGNFIDDFRLVADNLGIMVYKIDPLDPDSYGINPFINKSPAKVASIISTVLKGMYESENPDSSNVFFGQVTQQALENLAILLKVMYPQLHDGDIPTLEDMLECLYNYNLVEDMCEKMKEDPVLSVKHAILIKYFEKNFYNPPLDVNGKPVLGAVGSNRKETEMFLYGATTQLDNLMRNKMVRRILCSRDHNIDLDDVLSHGACVSVCTRRGELGALLAKPFGMFYILTMQDAVLRRPGDESTRIPHFMYIDEFPDFVNKETETCFTLFRKYRCGMVVAIQNLSQLERTKSMKFYKEVITSNCKTVAVFGDTNWEDSQYWSEAFGKFEYWDIGSAEVTKPVGNATKPDENKEKISMGIDFTYNIQAFYLPDMAFRNVFYRTRDANGSQVFGRGETNFMDKKYLKKYSSTQCDFEPYIKYNPDDPMLHNAHKTQSIISEETESNEALEGKVNESIEKQIEEERKAMRELQQSVPDLGEKLLDNVEYVKDEDVEIEVDDDIIKKK